MRWLGHVERMDEERGPVKALLLEVDGTKKGRPKKRWKEVLECARLDAQDQICKGLQCSRSDCQICKGWMLKIVKDGD